MIKRTILSLVALVAFVGAVSPASAQYDHHHRHCYYRHHHRVCR